MRKIGIKNVLAAFKKLRAGADLGWGIGNLFFLSGMHIRRVEQLSGSLH